MRRTGLKLVMMFVIAVSMTSCYTLTFPIGEGAKTGLTITEKNHYLIGGLAPIKTSNPQKMAGGAENYEVTIQHTFIDGLLNAITWGLYSPTTTTVKK